MPTPYMLDLQRQYWDATFALEDHDVKIEALAAQRDKIQAEADAKIDPINAQIEPLIAERVEHQERQGALARACGTKVGERQERKG